MSGIKKILLSLFLLFYCTNMCLAAVQVYEMQNLNLGDYDKVIGGDLEGSFGLCVYSSDAGGGYGLQINSIDADATQFRMRLGTTAEYIPIKVFWSIDGGTQFVEVLSAQSYAKTGAVAQVVDCNSSSHNVILKVTSLDVDLTTAHYGAYSTTLNITVSDP